MPRAEKRLPRHVLIAAEAERVLGLPSLALTPADGTVFLTNVGLAFEPNRLTQLAHDDADKAAIGKTGADLGFIQQLLGHKKRDTTQICAQVSIRMPKEVHTRTHPARLTGEPAAAAVPTDPEA